MTDAGLDRLETARLVLRRFTPEDEALLLRLNQSEAVMRHLGGVMDAAKNHAMLHQRILRYYGDHPGLGVWATMVKATGECAGFHLLNHVKGETLIQLGYRLFPEYWGLGYATEMGRALLRYGFVQRGLARIMANTHPDNLDSQRVLLKCGLHRRGERAYAHPDLAPFGVIPLFERKREDWLADFGAS